MVRDNTSMDSCNKDLYNYSITSGLRLIILILPKLHLV